LSDDIGLDRKGAGAAGAVWPTGSLEQAADIESVATRASKKTDLINRFMITSAPGFRRINIPFLGTITSGYSFSIYLWVLTV
jgi:hypothetical protein